MHHIEFGSKIKTMYSIPSGGLFPPCQTQMFMHMCSIKVHGKIFDFTMLENIDKITYEGMSRCPCANLDKPCINSNEGRTQERLNKVDMHHI